MGRNTIRLMFKLKHSPQNCFKMAFKLRLMKKKIRVYCVLTQTAMLNVNISVLAKEQSIVSLICQ
jgi:hypothetical protein